MVTRQPGAGIVHVYIEDRRRDTIKETQMHTNGLTTNAYEDSMNDETRETGEKLCLTCGLCCQGVFHTTAAILNTRDIKVARDIPVKILGEDTDTPRFELPCPAFCGSCTQYSYRPSLCREHQCKLLRHTLGAPTTIDTALGKVREMKQHLATLLPQLQM